MTAFLLSFGWNWLLAPVAIWFLNGLRKALVNPRLQVHTMTKAGKFYFLDVTRQQLLPPWQQKRETWLLHDHPEYGGGEQHGQATREGDGRTVPYVASASILSSMLGEALFGALRVAKARDAETEELSK